MKIKASLILSLAAAFTFYAIPAPAITALQVTNAVQARFAIIWPQIQPLMQACLEAQEDCYTTWSIGGTGLATDLCNTVTADSAVCEMAQTDPGTPDGCGIATGSHTFANWGWSLPATDIMAYKLNSYSGPGGRGAQICARLRYNGVGYEKCFGMGPQAGAFTDSAWRALP